MKNTLFLLLMLSIFGCKSQVKQVKIDLANLKLNEPIEKVINFKDTIATEVNTVEYPFSLLLDVKHDETYTFDGIDLKGQEVMFQINTEKLKTDSLTRMGGGHSDFRPVKNIDSLKKNLKEFDASNEIYGVRIELKTPTLQKEILQKLVARYGKGTKNPNTDNGLYWNVTKENKFVFYAPDYSRLIIVNNTNLSKTCYWDSANGTIDFGGCDGESYFKELTKNATKPEDVKNKPTITIHKDWNINDVVLGKTTEEEFLKSNASKAFERSVLNESSSSTTKITTTIYFRDENHDFSYFSVLKDGNVDDAKNHIINGYVVNDFRKTKIIFENGLKAGMSVKDAKKILANTPFEFSNYENTDTFSLKSGSYEIVLRFEDDKFKEIYTR